jgi:hypothetical protein
MVMDGEQEEEVDGVGDCSSLISSMVSSARNITRGVEEQPVLDTAMVLSCPAVSESGFNFVDAPLCFSPYYLYSLVIVRLPRISS